MKGKETRNLFLGSLILVLTISIGYFGISSAGSTYAIDAETSGTTSGNCYYCSSNALAKRYVWGSSTPSTACSGGNWTIKENRRNSDMCKAFTCKIYYNGENTSGISLTEITDFGKITSEVPTKSGYTFTGWSIDKVIYTSGSTFNCNSDVNHQAYATFKEIPAVCKWTTQAKCEKANSGYKCRATNADGTCWEKGDPISYNVVYNANGGSGAPSGQTKTHGSNLTLSSAKPTRDGYTFVNWNTNKDGTGTSYNSGATYSANAAVTLYAQWKTNSSGGGTTTKKYTVKFDSNGGTGSMNSVTCTVDSNCALSTNAFKKTGSTFKNWNTKKDGTGTSYNDKASVKNLTTTDGATVTLYAIWSTNSSDGTKKYTVKFDSNGGTGSMNNITCTVDSNCALSTNAFKKTGSTFKNWNTKKDGTGTSYNDKASVKNLATTDGAIVTLYAIWSTNSSDGTKKYTVKFDSNDGDGITKEVTCTVGSNCVLTKSGFSKDGFEFKGWNTKKDGTGISYVDGATVKDLSTTDGATVTLYAKWKQVGTEVNTYKVTYKYNDGVTKDKVIEVDENDTIYEILPERDGYTFDAWYTDEKLTKKYDFTNKIMEDITLYAKWTIGSASSPSDKTDDEITNNSKTGDVMMFIVWTIGIGTLAYSVYYFKTRKENL